MSILTITAAILPFPTPPSQAAFADGDPVWYRLAEQARPSAAQWAAGRVTGIDARSGKIRIELDYSKLTIWTAPDRLLRRCPGEIQPGYRVFGL